MTDITERVLETRKDRRVNLGVGDIVNLAQLAGAGVVTLYFPGVIVEISAPITQAKDSFEAGIAFVRGPSIEGNVPDEDQPRKDGIGGFVTLPNTTGRSLELLGDPTDGYLPLVGVALSDES